MLAIVYHDPGDESGHEMVRELARKVEEVSGVRVRALPMSFVEETEKPFNRGELVYSLIPFRGGHLATIIEKTRESGALYIGKIPLEIISMSLVKSLKGCEKDTLLYWKAKRFVNEQREDLGSLVKSIKENLGVDVDLETDVAKASGCIAVLTLLPGRVTRKALELHGHSSVKIPFLFRAIEEEIVKHVTGVLESLVKTEANKRV